MSFKQSRFLAYFDGGCEPYNPGGNMGWGVAIYERGSLVDEIYGCVKARRENSNNVAEYLAALEALKWFIDYGFQREKIRLLGDSKLVVSQLCGTMKIHKGLYVPWAHKARDDLRQFNRIQIIWIPREQNKKADALVREALRDLTIAKPLSTPKIQGDLFS